MEYPYKVEYLSSPRTKNVRTNPIDGVSLAKDLEALLLEYHQAGYDLVETKTINSHVGGVHTISDAAGMLVVFRKRDKL